MRPLELKAFEDKLPIERLFDFVRGYNVAEKAGMEPIKLHGFRHSCVGNLLASGLPFSRG